MRVCMCIYTITRWIKIYMHTHIHTCTCTHMYLHIPGAIRSKFMCAYMYVSKRETNVRMHVYLCISTCECECAYTRIYTCTCVCVHMHIIYVYVHGCVSINTFIYVCLHILKQNLNRICFRIKCTFLSNPPPTPLRTHPHRN